MKTSVMTNLIVIVLVSIVGFSLVTTYITSINLPLLKSGESSENITIYSNVTANYAPPPIDSMIPKTSYNDFIASVPTTSKILLPDKLPKNLLPTNVVGNLNNFVVILYSSNGYDTISKSELTLQITSTIEDPYPKNVTKGGTFFKIGDWSAYYNPIAPEFEPEYIQLYGNTCRLLNVRVGNTNYQFRAIPDITYDELIQIVSNMKSLY